MHWTWCESKLRVQGDARSLGWGTRKGEMPSLDGERQIREGRQGAELQAYWAQTVSSCCIPNVRTPSYRMRWLFSAPFYRCGNGHLPEVTWPGREGNSWKLSWLQGSHSLRTQEWNVCPTLEPRDDTLLLPSRESLSTPVTPAAIPCPATRPAVTVTIAGLTPWTLWSQSKTPFPRAAPATAASTPPSTPPVPAACHWPRHLGQPSHTSPQEVLAFVEVGVRPPSGPTMQTGGGRSLPPPQSGARARATDRSCTARAPAPPQAWRGAAATHQGKPGKACSSPELFRRS